MEDNTDPNMNSAYQDAIARVHPDIQDEQINSNV